MIHAVAAVPSITELLSGWRLVTTILGAFVGAISVGLSAIPGGREFTGQTSLYEFFGYFGLFCSTILVMRVPSRSGATA